MLVWLAVQPLCLPAAGQAESAAGIPDPAVQDMIYLADDGPKLIRLTIAIDGTPFRQAWDEFLLQVFRYADRDRNGLLDKNELSKIPPSQVLLQLVRGGYFSAAQRSSRPIAELGLTLVPGKVTPQGLANYYRLSGAEPLIVLSRDRAQADKPLSDALFRVLDTDRNGRLTKGESTKAQSALLKLDLNDDEVVDAQEIVPAAEDERARPRPAATMLLADDAPFFVATNPEAAARLRYVLLEHYDKDRNLKLGPHEIHLPDDSFDRLDRNKDKVLSSVELGKYLATVSPDLQVTVSLTRAQGWPPTVHVGDPLGRLVERTERAAGGGLNIRHSRSRLDLVLASSATDRFTAARQLIIAQFESADATRRGYLDAVQVQQNPVLRSLFPPGSEDNSFRLARTELLDFLDVLNRSMGSCVVLLITDHGRSLMELLSERHDGRLRRSEMAGAWRSLQPWVRQGFEELGVADLPRQLHLAFSLGQPGDFTLQPAPDAPPADAESRPVPVTSNAPLWFRKMDRNDDGLVSLREFLGTRENFRSIDTNSDGVIDREEAERATPALQAGTSPGSRAPGR